MSVIEIYLQGILKERYLVESVQITIGRSHKNQIVLRHPEISSFHAVIKQNEMGYFIEDLESTNGTFVNVRKISGIQRVNAQDIIAIGKYTIKLPRNTQIKDEHHDELSCYLELKGEITGLQQLSLEKESYGIGKHKNNDIQISGLLIADYFAEIKKDMGNYCLNPLNNNKVLLNNSKIEHLTLLSHSDEIKIKNLVLKFFIEA